jgi:MYXO-CTERM domain-containing protein
MRRIAGTALIAILLAIAPAGTAFSQTTEQPNSTIATATVQAQDTKDDEGNEGLWGLFGLLGLAGLIPWRKKTRERQPYQDTTRTTGM